jgi:antitoxin YokJ
VSTANEISSLLDALRRNDECYVLPAETAPTVSGYDLPQDLSAFYALCGGVALYEHAGVGVRVVGPSRFVPATPFIVGDEVMREAREAGAIVPDMSDDWFVIASAIQDSDVVVTIDMSTQRFGRCYDSSLGRHANPGYSTIIALSFTEFLARSIHARGLILYWDDPAFRPYGDAYDEP